MYSTYCSESLSRQEALQTLLQAKGWPDFSQTVTGVLDISSYLIKPVQRYVRVKNLTPRVAFNVFCIL
jgi:hypothetical protein